MKRQIKFAAGPNRALHPLPTHGIITMTEHEGTIPPRRAEPIMW